MGLFTDPMTLVDADTTDRIFEFRAQLPENGAIVGEYIEPAADVSSESKLVVKHSSTKAGRKRHLIGRSEVFDLTEDPTDGSEPVVVNLTVSHNPKHTAADIQNQLTLVIDAAQETNFLAKLVRDQI